MTYRRLDANGPRDGWYIDESNNDTVFLQNGSVVFRIDEATGNVTVSGTLGVTGAATLSGGASGAVTATTLSTSGAMTTTNGVGAAAADGTLVSEEGGGGQHLSKLTFTSTTAAAGAALADGALVYTFPAVPCLVRGVYVSGTLTAATETGTPEIGVGTLIGSGANATLGAVGATAEDIIEGTASEAFASGGTAFTRNSAVAKCPLVVAASSVLHVNYALGYTATENVTVAGTVWIDWCELS